ncbi:hypothetical protein ElyMa_003843800 [Elysia marginata]|uniref:Uncharacterized protein n=1 Tax=Elysia marginata TaxID=1093978 RepID=A0AAV4FHY6_9GAST|nr:hypothetical protein ElyMa_003843800 [Elysia marginata]
MDSHGAPERRMVFDVARLPCHLHPQDLNHKPYSKAYQSKKLCQLGYFSRDKILPNLTGLCANPSPHNEHGETANLDSCNVVSTWLA